MVFVNYTYFLSVTLGVLMLDSITGTQFCKRGYFWFVLRMTSDFCIGRLRAVKGMMGKVPMEVSGNGPPLFSISSMDSYPQNYIPGIIFYNLSWNFAHFFVCKVFIGLFRWETSSRGKCSTSNDNVVQILTRRVSDGWLVWHPQITI